MICMMDAGEWVRELRERHHLSQAQLAYRAGTSQQALSKIEHGVVSPSIETLARLASVVGEELVLGHRSREVPFEEAQLLERARMPIGDRLRLAISWNKFAGEIAGKAAEALRGD